MELREFLNNSLKKASVPGQKIFARDIYNEYASRRLHVDSPDPTPTFLHFVDDLKNLGYRVSRNTAKHRHGQTQISDVVWK